MDQEQEQSRVCFIRNNLGLHARPAALLVKTACQYDADIKIKHEKVEIDGKSILSLMTLAAEEGTCITVTARGRDAVEALNAIEKLFEDNFGEK